MFLGCIVDRSPCVGTQKNPSTTPAGYANVLSNNYPSVAGWDNTVGYTWFTNDLSAGTHTIVIIAAVGNPLVPFRGTGTLFIEARNLIVTVATP